MRFFFGLKKGSFLGKGFVRSSNRVLNIGGARLKRSGAKKRSVCVSEMSLQIDSSNGRVEVINIVNGASLFYSIVANTNVLLNYPPGKSMFRLIV